MYYLIKIIEPAGLQRIEVTQKDLDTNCRYNDLAGLESCFPFLVRRVGRSYIATYIDTLAMICRHLSDFLAVLLEQVIKGVASSARCEDDQIHYDEHCLVTPAIRS
jgi:hypothetical protein